MTGMSTFHSTGNYWLLAPAASIRAHVYYIWTRSFRSKTRLELFDDPSGCILPLCVRKGRKLRNPFSSAQTPRSGTSLREKPTRLVYEDITAALKPFILGA